MARRAPKKSSTPRALAAACAEIAHHELRGLQQTDQIHRLRTDLGVSERLAGKLQTMLDERHAAAQAGGYLHTAKRFVPFCYWPDGELLSLLHQLERTAAGKERLMVRLDGEPDYEKVTVPEKLLLPLIKECQARGILLPRFTSTSLAVAT